MELFGAKIDETWQCTGPISPQQLDTPLIRLLDLVYSRSPEKSRHWLRKHITLNYTPTTLCLQMIRIHAKRWRYEPETQFENIKHISVYTNHAYQKHDDGLLLSETQKIVQRLNLLKAKGTLPISALLFDQNGHCILESWNTNEHFKHHHAEFNLLKSALHLGLLHKGSYTVVSSLKPCKACAAALEACFKNNGTIKVYYLEDDPGPHARLSPDQTKWIHKLVDTRLV